LLPRRSLRVRFARALRHPARFTPVAVALLLVWCGFLFFYGLSAGPLYRTEALRAIVGAETLKGRWLVPTLYGEPFLTKPPGNYVAIGLVSLPFGEVTDVSARLPSAFAATVAVLCFYWTLRRHVGRGGALIGGLLLPVSVLWLDKAPSAEIDMLQLMWVSVGLFFFLRALESAEEGNANIQHPSSNVQRPTSNVQRPMQNVHRSSSLDVGRWMLDVGRSSYCWWLLAMLAVTMGFLTKWTAPAFFYLTVIPLLIWRKQLRLLWSVPHLVGVALAGTIVAAWACAVAAQTGWPLLFDTITREALQRFAPEGVGKPHPWSAALAFPLAVLGANLPWSGLALFTLRPSFFRLWDERGRRLLQLLHCWTWPNLLFWSLSSQHHVRYWMPAAPGLIGLGIMVCIAWQSRRLTWPIPRLRPATVLAAVLFSWLGAKVAYVEGVIPARTAGRHVRETAAKLRDLVPENEILYLCGLKDEGIMFYYGRPVRKLGTTPPGEGRYVALTAAEWAERDRLGHVEDLRWLRDQQGDAFVLARISSEPTGGCSLSYSVGNALCGVPAVGMRKPCRYRQRASALESGGTPQRAFPTGFQLRRQSGGRAPSI
jgi:4-amino-4-deoxy-L-arabinose transferase-like glycosyltransferase